MSDIFVIMDNLEYTRGNYISRNRILSMNGISYLTIPVDYKQSSRKLISEINLDTRRYLHSVRKIIETIRHSYSKKPGFKTFFPVFEQLMKKERDTILHLDMEMIESITNYLNITTQIILASSLNISGCKENELFIDLCSKTRCDQVLLGLGASTKYINKEKITGSGIQITYQNFVHPVYSQGKRNFYPGISIVDLLFNVEKKEAEMLVKNSGSIEK